MSNRVHAFAIMALFLGVSPSFACSAGEGTAGTGTPPGGGGSSGVNGIGGTGQGGTSNGGFGAGTIGTGGQGFDPDAACVTTSSRADAAVDIIWVIDNSLSMDDEIDKIENNINNSFLGIIEQSNLAWNLIFVTHRQGHATPLGLPRLPVCVRSPPAGPACADSPPRFHHVACAVGSKSSLAALQHSFDGSPGPNVGDPYNCEAGKYWQNYLRFDATKVFMVVSDDDYGGTVNQVHTWLTDQAAPLPAPGMFGTANARKYIFNAIVGMNASNPNTACSSATNSADSPGLKYQQLAADTGGHSASICEDDWSGIFDTVANTLVSNLGCDYPVPDPADGQNVDPNLVNVSFTPENGGGEVVLQDNNAPCAAGADGWQWNADQSRVLLCGPTCERVRSDPGGQIDIQFGCVTEIAPPK